MTESSQTIDEARPEWVSLATYSPPTDYTPGRSPLVRGLWAVVSLVIFQSGWVPLYGIKRWLLRRFGASVGAGVVIKPHVRIKFPWRLRIGAHAWIGEDVWIDNLATIHLANDVCVSQGAYLCTGSHDHRRVTFDLIVKPIVVESAAWVGARAIVLPGVTIRRGAVVASGSVVTRDVPPGVIVGGSPSRVIGERTVSPI
ncbi:MAG TPA: WcaF family extracellular polysaccharide biosynthesis acetyltransferase [Planctomycetaceae bacterium]|nr:WcaF family extracellular polysaccharide biosynthesis acetyltransferase [Planctomycetaceae bacterium]